MNRGVMQSSPVQQMVAGNPNWWNINNMRPPPQRHSPFLVPPPPNDLFPQYTLPPTSSSSSLLLSSSWHDNQELPAESWSQLILGGLVGEEDKSCLRQLQGKKLGNWEEQMLHDHAPNGSIADVKLEHSESSYVYSEGNVEFQEAKPTWYYRTMPLNSSPKSCVTTNMFDFSTNKAGVTHPPPDRSSECNSTVTGGTHKKARVQQSSTQPVFKVRKEKLGDRITALHQLVSPFGKTDTASVLLEAIGYIRFLQNQIEALSLPYLGTGSGGPRRQQQSVQRERNCLFPKHPGQDSKEGPKDLRSRGLCLVPISFTLEVDNDNGADYWAAGGEGFQ